MGIDCGKEGVIVTVVANEDMGYGESYSEKAVGLDNLSFSEVVRQEDGLEWVNDDTKLVEARRVGGELLGRVSHGTRTGIFDGRGGSTLNRLVSQQFAEVLNSLG